MVNYNKSMIYQICCNDTNIKEVYIGSTVNFKSRKNQHKTSCNNPNSKGYNLKLYQFIRAMGGWENWDMVLIDTVSCESKLELLKIERQYIEDTKLTLNCKIPSRSHKEWGQQYYEVNKEKIKEYRNKNKEQTKEYMKQYYENNKDKLLEYKKEYRENNKEKIKEYYETNKYREKKKEYLKEYYQINKQKLNEKIICECGATINKHSKKRHEKSIKHITGQDGRFKSDIKYYFEPDSNDNLIKCHY